MRRLLFLDIDGVLNSHAFFQSVQGRSPPADREAMARGMIDPAAVALLDGLIEKSEAEVVISSSWRLAYSLGEIGRALGANGFKARRSIIGRTERLADSWRGTEIQKWIDVHADASALVVILDDDEDMGSLRHRLVRTHYLAGLQPEHVGAALKLFGVTQ